MTPSRREWNFGTIAEFIKAYYLPRLLVDGLSQYGYSVDRRAYFAEFSGCDFGEIFTDFTFQQIGVFVQSTKSLERLNNILAKMTSLSQAFVPIERDTGTYDVYGLWCHRVWNATTRAHIETVWIGDSWVQSIEGIETAQIVTAKMLFRKFGEGAPSRSVENVIDQITRLAQGLRVLPHLGGLGGRHPVHYPPSET